MTMHMSPHRQSVQTHCHRRDRRFACRDLNTPHLTHASAHLQGAFCRTCRSDELPAWRGRAESTAQSLRLVEWVAASGSPTGRHQRRRHELALVRRHRTSYMSLAVLGARPCRAVRRGLARTCRSASGGECRMSGERLCRGRRARLVLKRRFRGSRTAGDGFAAAGRERTAQSRRLVEWVAASGGPSRAFTSGRAGTRSPIPLVRPVSGA